MNPEVNFDGLIGPTHNYAGLSLGNMASLKHKRLTSYPKKAALQGLHKMRQLIELGYLQGFLLPQWRPDLSVLHQQGFRGSDRQMLIQAANKMPELLPLIYSASSMWAANAATVTPSVDTRDGKLHITTANLATTPHRAIEAQQTTQCLQQIFSDPVHFMIHPALTDQYFDEGAANHNRLCDHYLSPAVGLFVHGDGTDSSPGPVNYPVRQTRRSSEAVANQHGIMARAVFVQQNPLAIDAGAFHNDVVAVANGPVLFYHELAFEPLSFKNAVATFEKHLEFKPICVPERDVSLNDAVSSYLFNSQLLAEPSGALVNMCLIAPMECAENSAVADYLETLVDDSTNPINKAVFVDVRQSMSNGGGPACLRLRVVMTPAQVDAIDQRFLLNLNSLDSLADWVAQYYPDEINPDDLKDPQLMTNTFEALEALAQLLQLGQYYASSS